jgi:hypothetical protein
MSASHPALQDHAQAAADAFSQRYVQPRARKGRRGGSSSGIDLCRLGREPDSKEESFTFSFFLVYLEFVSVTAMLFA